MIHELKIWVEFFQRVFTGQKKFEVRKNDRHFMVNDTLHLKEWDNIKNDYTGRELFCKVTYILQGGQFGIEEGYCVMGIQQ